MNSVLRLSTCAAAVSIASASIAQSQSTTTNQTPPSNQVQPSPEASEAASPGARSGGVEEIVVTAQRRSERLQNVPVAVTAASAARLEAAGIANTQELAIVTPGLSAPQQAGYTQPHIRGVGSSTNGPGLEPPVATYIDGVYIAAAPASLLTLNNVERIEVLKGPQGTLFGRNSTGGLIQVITKDPKKDFSGAVNLSYANYNDVTADAYVTGGLADNLAADVAVRYEHQGDGWGRNLGTGHPTGDLDHDFAGRVKFLFEPSNETQIRLSADYEDRISTRDTQHLGTQYPGTFNNAFFGGPFPQGGIYDINNDIDPVNKLRAGGASLQITHQFDTVTFQSITAYRESQFSFLLDLDVTPANILNAFGVAHDTEFTQELQLSSAGTGRLKWVGGLFFFDAHDRWSPLDINFGPSPLSPVPGKPVTIDERDQQRTTSFAGYAQATYEVLADTNVTLGGRYTYERKRLDGSSAFLVAGTNFGTTPIPNPALGIPSTIDFKRFNYRVALDHKFGEDILAYVSYNTGFKSGGYNLAVPTNVPYQPESIGAAEVGLKTEFFDHHLRLNAAAYRYSYSNIQVARFINSNESIYNGARARIYGFDVDGELVLTRGLSLNGGLAYNHARFTSFPLADFIVPVNGCVPAPGGICAGSAAGHVLPFAPETTFNIGADYKVDLNFGTIAADATYFHTSRFFSSPDNVGYQAGYDLVNASISWTDLSHRYSVKLWGKNLSGTVYATSLIEAQQGQVRGLGAPRTYGVTAGFKF